MPIYAYKCASCGHAKDVLRRMSDDPLTLCPACGQEAFEKQVTAAGFQLKGSGWYVTDFRGGSNAAAPSGDGATADSGDKASKVAASAPPVSESSVAGAAPAASPAPSPVAAPAPAATKTSGSSN